jgi:hypothetical protein
MNTKLLLVALSGFMFWACSDNDTNPSTFSNGISQNQTSSTITGSSSSKNGAVAATLYENKVKEACILYMGNQPDQFKTLASAGVDADFTVEFTSNCSLANAYGKCEFTLPANDKELPNARLIEYAYKKPTLDSADIAQRKIEDKMDCDDENGTYTTLN